MKMQDWFNRTKKEIDAEKNKKIKTSGEVKKQPAPNKSVKSDPVILAPKIAKQVSVNDNNKPVKSDPVILAPKIAKQVSVNDNNKNILKTAGKMNNMLVPITQETFRNCTEEELESVYNYTRKSSVINRSLRGKKSLRRFFSFSPKANIRTVNRLDRVIQNSAPTTEPMQVTRGTPGTEIFGDKSPKDMIGAIVSDDAYSSTTTDPFVATKFIGLANARKPNSSYTLKINCPKGTKGLYVGNINHPRKPNLYISEYPTESEFILPRQRQFMITGYDEETRTVHMHLVNYDSVPELYTE